MNRVQSLNVLLIIIVAVFLPYCGGGAPSQSTLPNVTLVTLSDGEQAIEEGRFDEAADIFSQLIAQTPNDPVLHYYLGLSKDNMGDADGAIAAYQKALSLNQSLTNARLNLGLVYFHQGNLTAAITEFETVEAAEPAASDVQYNLGMALAAAGKTDDARVHYEKSASLDPEDPDPLIALGNMEKDAGNNDEAMALFEKAETLGTGSAVAVLSGAQLLIAQNKQPAAAKKLMTLIEMDADAETLASAGLMLSKMGKADDAIAIYRHALDVSPESSKAALLLGNALARKGDFAEAATWFQKIIDLSPDAPEAGAAQKGLAACKARLGQ
ncbi:MAG: tetratricopeptide repeat protein [Deltaproteobacteria bacterium]|nr:tetratricopeptide repeat protein [Deltaproteobacteria bacterium]